MWGLSDLVCPNVDSALAPLLIPDTFFQDAKTCLADRSEGFPRTGYLVPGRDGPGVWPDGRVVGTSPSPPPSSGNSGRHSGQETIFGVFHMVLGSW